MFLLKRPLPVFSVRPTAPNCCAGRSPRLWYLVLVVSDYMDNGAFICHFLQLSLIVTDWAGLFILIEIKYAILPL